MHPDRLCLVGMSGIGKSFWARRLSGDRGFRWHDCDAAIAAALGALVRPEAGEASVHALGRWMGSPWSPGYAEREARYLELEERVTRGALTELAALPGAHVLDTTGSVIHLSPALLAELRRRCRVVYLRAPAGHDEVMLRLYLAEPKPVVWGGAYAAAPGEEPAAALPRCFAALLRARDQRYLALAHSVVEVSALTAAAQPLALLCGDAGGCGA